MIRNDCPAQHVLTAKAVTAKAMTAKAATANADRARRLRLGSAQRARIQLISDGVVASYIHDVSVRHRPRHGETRRDRASAGRLALTV